MNKKSGLILRIMLGAYLTYLGVDLVRTIMAEKPSDMMMKAAMGVAFIIVGICYAIWAIRGAWKLYKTANPDMEKEEENPEEKVYKRPVTDKTKYRTAPMPGQGEIEQAMREKSSRDTKNATVADVTLDLSDRENIVAEKESSDCRENPEEIQNDSKAEEIRREDPESTFEDADVVSEEVKDYEEK